MSVKISIGSAIYNVKEQYLRQHIESIMKQLTDESELLLIDDCSKDNSGNICNEYAMSDNRIRYIKMDQNSGLSCVRNRTIQEAKGQWIFFADGDDILSDHAVETAISLCNDDYDIIIHNRQIFHDKKNVTDQPCDIKEPIPLPAEAGRDISVSCLCSRTAETSKYKLGSDAYYHAAWGALYRRDFLLSNDLKFPVGQKKAQDSVFNTYAYFYAKKISYLPYTMYYYRKDMQGITQRYNPDLTQTSISLIKHHRVCMEKLYPGDIEVEKKYKNNRLVALTVDSMRLNILHKDNPKPKEVRKQEFLDFINTEPFKSAIIDYDSTDAWWGWIATITLAKKQRFAALDFFFKHWRLFQLYGSLLKLILSHRR